MVQEIERSTRLCQIFYFVELTVCMLGLIGLQFVSVLLIRVMWSVFLMVLILIDLKREVYVSRSFLYYRCIS